MFDKAWFVALLKQKGMSQRQFATRLGVDASAITLLFNGERVMRVDEAAKIAAILNQSLPTVLAHAGVEGLTESRRVQIKGVIADDEGTVVSVAPGSEDMVDGPRDMPPTAYAVQVRNHKGKFTPFDRWLVFASGEQGTPGDAIGMLAICGLQNGKQCLAHVEIGYKAGTFNLHFGDYTQHNTDVIWAMRVLWLKPSGSRQGGPL